MSKLMKNGITNTAFEQKKTIYVNFGSIFLKKNVNSENICECARNFVFLQKM